MSHMVDILILFFDSCVFIKFPEAYTLVFLNMYLKIIEYLSIFQNEGQHGTIMRKLKIAERKKLLLT